MSEEQETNLEIIQNHFRTLADSKYRKGAEEHKSDLFALSRAELLEHAIEEAIDQVIYLLTLKRQLTLDDMRRWEKCK